MNPPPLLLRAAIFLYGRRSTSPAKAKHDAEPHIRYAGRNAKATFTTEHVRLTGGRWKSGVLLGTRRESS